MQDYPIEQVQPDGSKLSLLVTGDEYLHNMHDQKGYTVLIHPRTGYAVYAVPDGRGIKASEYVVGRFDPATLNIQPGLRQEFDPEARAEAMPHNRVLSYAPNSGTINNIVIFIRFLDQAEYTTPLATYETMFNSTTTESVRDYFLHESMNQLTVNSTFYPAAEGGIVRSFQDGHDRSYFMAYNAETNPDGYSTEHDGKVRIQTMMHYAVNSISASIPAGLNLDGNNDGMVDNITFVVQGGPEAYWGSPLWSQQYWLDLFSPLEVPYTYINGKFVSVYSLQLSDLLVSPDNGSTIGTGVICHETSHCIGFPDLYHYSQDGRLPVGTWELMGTHGILPQPHSAFMKMKYGNWVASLPTISPSSTPTTYTLTAINDNPYSCYKIASGESDQFYVLEYLRQNSAYGSSLPGSGLIVYRITESYLSGIAPISLRGNSDGPPDEVYIYRPDGTINDYGTIDQANLSSSVNRNELHNNSNPTPWLYNIFANAALPGNLFITDITENTGSSISFTLHASQPHVWTGVSSTDWFTPSNWNTGSIPTESSWVEIPVTTTHYPLITGTAAVRTLYIKSNAQLNVANGSLYVAEDANIYGALNVLHANADINITGNMTLFSGGVLHYTADGYVHIRGNAEFAAGSDVNSYFGNLDFYGSGDSSLLIHEDIVINNLLCNKTNPYLLVLSVNSTRSLTVRGDLWVNSGNMGQDYSGTTKVMGNITVASSGACFFANGTVQMQGNANQNISLHNTASYFHNLSINCNTAAMVNLMTGMSVKGNLSISSGALYTSNHLIKLGGDWINTLGTNGFFEGMGTVMLNGSGAQNIGSESFYRLELNKTAGYMSIATGANVFCYHYDWTAGEYRVAGGNLTVDDLDDPGIFGDIKLSGGSISYTQDAESFIDLRGNLQISGGSFTTAGGSGNAYLSYIDDASLTMSGGVLDVVGHGMVIPDMPGVSFVEDITGGTIRCNGSFCSEMPDFNPQGGTLELYGSGSHDLNLLPGSYLHHLTINKDNNECSINLQNQLYLFGTLTVEKGVLYTNGFTLNSHDVIIDAGSLILYGDHYCSGNLNINGRMDIYPSYHLFMGAGKDVNVNNGGYLYCYGSAAAPATVTRYGSSGYYGFNVEWGGTLAAEYAVFEYMDAYGVNIKAGAMVDPYASLNFCTFRNGAIAGRLLTLNNSQVFTINGAMFPENTWNGANNVAKNVVRGSVSFVGYSGAFCGEAYEQDTYGNINWQQSGIPGINNLSITYIHETDSVRLNWDYPLPFSLFRIYYCDTPTGEFTCVGQTTDLSWVGTVPAASGFYRVSVEN